MQGPNERLMAEFERRLQELATVVREHPEGITVQEAHAELVRRGCRTWKNYSVILALGRDNRLDLSRHGIEYLVPCRSHSLRPKK